MLVNETVEGALTASKDRSEPRSTPASTVDFQNFLRLLTTQLRYQDPTAPIDSTQFVSQLASFATVEQLVEANRRLDSLVSSLESAEFQRYGAWVGLTARLADGVADFAGEPTNIEIEASADAYAAELVARDASGREIDRRSVANASRRLQWDGVVNGVRVSPGRYSLSVDYLHASGAILESRPAVILEKISDVRLMPEGPEFGLFGGRRVPAAAVIGVGM